MGDQTFARARAAEKNETEAGHASAKAEADIALSLPAEYRDEKYDTKAECIMHSAKPASRTPVEQQTHIHPRRPRLVIAMRCLLFEVFSMKFGE